MVGQKVLGAGILGSCLEIEHVGLEKPRILPWRYKDVLETEFTLSKYQPFYYSAESLGHMKELIQESLSHLC